MNSLANNLCSDHRDKQSGKPCLACEIDRLRAEIVRLKRGDFTPEEFQNLCHHRDEKPGCTRLDFEKGCRAYQTELFGLAPPQEFVDLCYEKNLAEEEAAALRAWVERLSGALQRCAAAMATVHGYDYTIGDDYEPALDHARELIYAAGEEKDLPIKEVRKRLDDLGIDVEPAVRRVQEALRKKERDDTHELGGEG